MKEQGLAVDLQTGLERVSQALDSGSWNESSRSCQRRARRRRPPAASCRFRPCFAALDRAVRDAAQNRSASERSSKPWAARSGSTLTCSDRCVTRSNTWCETPSPTGSRRPPSAARHRKSRRAAACAWSSSATPSAVHFSCHDDGRGIDVTAVRRELVQREPAQRRGARGPQRTGRARAAARGLAVDGHERSDADRRARHRPRRRARGDGTPSRRRSASRVRTEAGRGTSIEISVPVSLAALRALVVDAGGVTVAIPLEAVSETVRLTSADFQRARRKASPWRTVAR